MPGSFAPRSVFRRLLIRAVVVPALLSLGFGVVLVWQISNLIADANAVELVNRVIAQANRLAKLHVDLETGVRGYVITGDRAFLRPYEDARATLEPVALELHTLVADRAEQQAILGQIEALRVRWQAYADTLLHPSIAPAEPRAIVGAGEGRRLKDEIRVLFDRFIATEEALRAERSGLVQRSARLTAIVTCTVALGIGAGLSLLSVRQLRVLSRNYEEALAAAARSAAELERRVAERTRELGAANAALTEANAELEAFAYSISHDLRAPMRHIAGFADLLRQSVGAGLKPDDAESLATIHDTAKLAGRMVDDLLGFSRIGRVQLGTAEVDMVELAGQCRLALAPETARREIRWHVLPLPPVQGDRALLRLALQNLLANAIKYTAPRAVAEIEIGARPEQDGVTYWVRDNGVGFDPIYAHKLFGVFQRLHRAEEFEGTGIGLANVRRIVLRHGGRVWAEGQLDQGATFYFWLPSAASVRPTAPSHPPLP